MNSHRHRSSVTAWLLQLTFGLLICLGATAADVSSHQSSTSNVHPNIVFLVVESTDGRTWQRGYQNDVIPLPNLRRLEDGGATSFYRHYCNSPVCCPSRASFWSGKFPHKIPHFQTQNNDTHYRVEGVWNNFEGLPLGYSQTIFDVLQPHYATFLSGKQDFTTGSHSMSVRMNAWTMNAPKPYNWTSYEPWAEESSTCRSNGTVTPALPETPEESESHKDDWKALNETLDWIRNYTHNNKDENDGKPFFVYQGMNIVHPPYHTNDYWLDKIDPSKITVPEWPTLNKMHPCDVHQSMLKGCLPISEQDSQHVLDAQRRQHIRRIYYAMIAEFDAMVGRYMDLLYDELALQNTILIVTSDHGDMQMEHGQYYKMSPYQASSSVPLIIYDPRHRKQQIIDAVPTQHVDLFPTILELAGISVPSHLALDGFSLVPLLDQYSSEAGKEAAHGGVLTTPPDDALAPRTSRRIRAGTTTSDETSKEDDKNSHDRPPFVVVQYHGDDSPMSWFAIVQGFPCMSSSSSSSTNVSATDAQRQEQPSFQQQQCLYKLVIWGTGQQVDSQLFDLTNDPDENMNLIHDADYELIVGGLHTNLETVVDYRAVAQNVAQYNVDSFLIWKDQHASNWKELLNDTSLRWHSSWSRNPSASLAAIEEWITHGKDDPVPIQGCRRESAWPPPPQ